MKKICVLCGEEFEGYGNNAAPLAEGICCDSCNVEVVKKRISFFDTTDYAIQKYEDELPDMLLDAHKDYENNKIDAEAYADALRKIYTIIDMLYIGGKR